MTSETVSLENNNNGENSYDNIHQQQQKTNLRKAYSCPSSDFSFPTVTNDTSPVTGEQNSAFDRFCLLIRDEQPSQPANR
jgi:hypothetical protein